MKFLKMITGAVSNSNYFLKVVNLDLEKSKQTLYFWVFWGRFIELKLGPNDVLLVYFSDEISKNRSLCTGGAVSSSNYFLKSSTLA